MEMFLVDDKIKKQTFLRRGEWNSFDEYFSRICWKSCSLAVYFEKKKISEHLVYCVLRHSISSETPV